ncbi:MAG: hypothetical protein ACYC9Y_04135 [Candidatus Methylomirabilia bacterium]
MSRAGLGQRIAVFVVFASLAVAVASTFVTGVPAAAPTRAELEALEAKMTTAARLHLMAAIPAPAGPAPWCAGCHPGLPHPGVGVDRAMLNEHAARMDCLLCHWSAAGGSRPVPAWQVRAGAVEYLALLTQERLSNDGLSALRSAVLASRRCFVRGPSCDGCHRPGEIGTLVRPGSTPARVAVLGRLEDHFTLAPGAKWYFPRIQ